MNECIYKIIDDMIYESSLKLNEISNKQSNMQYWNIIMTTFRNKATEILRIIFKKYSFLS